MVAAGRCTGEAGGAGTGRDRDMMDQLQMAVAVT